MTDTLNPSEHTSAPCTLVLLFHPLGSGLVNRALAQAAGKVPGVTVIDEYAAYPDGRIDVAHEQDLLDHADHIVLQFPMHWYSAPALAQQWEDDVLAWGWAYGGGRHLLDKTLHVAVTCGAGADAYTKETAGETEIGRLLSPFEATAHRVHMDWGKPFTLYGASSLNGDQVAEASAEYARFLHGLD